MVHHPILPIYIYNINAAQMQTFPSVNPGRRLNIMYQRQVMIQSEAIINWLSSPWKKNLLENIAVLYPVYEIHSTFSEDT